MHHALQVLDAPGQSCSKAVTSFLLFFYICILLMFPANTAAVFLRWNN